ncbi:pesticidal crystal protein cry4Aa, partial [Bacillus cereus]
MTCRTASAEQKYFIRIRYASNGWVTAIPMINLIITQVESLAMQLNQTFAHTNYQELQYQEFGYLEFPNEVTLPANETISLIFDRLDSFSDSAVIIDKVEFLPITSSLLESREREKIEFAQMKVSSFFTNHTKNILQADVTDYEIDQTATLIESLTEEVYPQEKLMLLHEIKQAKQLSQSRNLLQNGDFTSLLGWTTSKDITIQTGNSDFKGYSLHMTGARTTGLSSSIFPTYIYQKIQEVALKPYTRYRIR